MSYYYIHIKIAQVKRPKMPTVGKDVKQLKLSYPTESDAEYHLSFGTLFGNSLIN